jgi:hypothetical protein
MTADQGMVVAVQHRKRRLALAFRPRSMGI